MPFVRRYSPVSMLILSSTVVCFLYPFRNSNSRAICEGLLSYTAPNTHPMQSKPLLSHQRPTSSNPNTTRIPHQPPTPQNPNIPPSTSSIFFPLTNPTSSFKQIFTLSAITLGSNVPTLAAAFSFCQELNLSSSGTSQTVLLEAGSAAETALCRESTSSELKPLPRL